MLLGGAAVVAAWPPAAPAAPIDLLSALLRIFTHGNAWFLRMEDTIGTLEAGKLADLVVLDRDYFTVPDNQLRNIRSVLTMVDGRIVHNDGVA